MHAITIIPLIIMILFLIAIVYYWVKEDSKNKETMDVISTISNRYRLTGKITPESNTKNMSQTHNNFLHLEEIARLFKYDSESNSFWIEYTFKNNTLDDMSFVFNKAVVTIDEEEIECDLSLLLEFVPEYLARPYGIRYFNTKSFNNYILGVRGQKTFRFESRFPLESRNNFKASDLIRVEIELNKFETSVNKYVPFEKLVFSENFRKISQQTVYSVNEQIKWED
ncbi:hypothetical protein [Pedobacter sp.]|uniref:hypothetical protein n=1 Tax=Pedobacter sp. TaxID=1411316 RepID=UPI003BAD95AD